MSNGARSRQTLASLIYERLADEGASWLEGVMGKLSDLEFGPTMNEVSRTLGRRPLIGSFAQRGHARLPGAHGDLKVGHWKTDEAAKVLLVGELAARTETPFKTLFGFYDHGDTEVRVAALRALNFVQDDDIAAGLELVYDAGRTYLDELLGAAWCDNPFSAAHLSDVEYRKAVLKALFCNVSVDDFIGLEARADTDMAESLQDFADEREAAGRSVPDAVWIVAAHYPRPGLVARLIGRLEHPLPACRLTAARALANAADKRTVSFIEERIPREEDSEVREALETALAVSREGKP